MSFLLQINSALSDNTIIPQNMEFLLIYILVRLNHNERD